MVAADIPVEFSKGEAGRGQHEVNVTYGRAIEVADRHLVFKNGVKEIADQCGRSASFMAKWSMARGGLVVPHPRQRLGRRVRCSAHVGRRRAVATLRGRAGNSSPGLLVGARQLTWLWAPYVNSYKRYVPGSWAPTAAVWGVDNRTCGFRLVGHGEGRRVECRIPGADVNPYLALAGIFAAGLWGVEHGLELATALRGKRLRRHRRAAGADHPGGGHRRARVVADRAPTHSATTSITISSTPPVRSGPGRTRPSPTGSCSRNFERI